MNIYIFYSGLGVIIFIASRQAMSALNEYKKGQFDEKTIRQKFDEFDKNKSGSLDITE